MEAEAICHNITGSDTEVLECREFDEVPRELISNAEIVEKENNKNLASKLSNSEEGIM
jgi:hypothetical protein